MLGKRSLQDRVPSPSSISISSPPSTPSTPKSKRVAGDGEKGHDGQAARPDITRISTLVDSVSTSSLPSLPRANATLPPKPSFAAIPALASSSSHVLPRRDVSYWSSRAPAAFQQPSQIASFSYDEQRTLFHDDRAMRYYHPPPSASLLESYANANPYGPGTGARTRMGARAGVQNRGADLNRGFENFKQRDESVVSARLRPLSYLWLWRMCNKRAMERRRMVIPRTSQGNAAAGKTMM